MSTEWKQKFKEKKENRKINKVGISVEETKQAAG
jgi:hypothetical protein